MHFDGIPKPRRSQAAASHSGECAAAAFPSSAAKTGKPHRLASMKTAATERDNFAFWVNTHDFDPSIALSLRSSWLAAELAYLCVAASSPHAADSRLTALPTLRPWTGETGAR